MEATGEIIDIRKWGAVGDGIFKNTEIIQRCLDESSQKGGIVYVGGGGTYVCGTLYLPSNVTVFIGPGTRLLASPDILDYGPDTHHNRYRNEKELDRCWLYSCGTENIQIMGNGVLDGNGEAFPNEGSIYRPMMLRFLRCRNVRLSGLQLLNAAAWTTAFLDSSYIWASGLVIENEKRYNGDGLDFDGCAHVFVRDCRISGTDDNLCLQAGSREYPVEDVHISGCSFQSLCAGIRIGLRSIGTIKNVVISNCTMKNVWREGIKIECSEGGRIANIGVENVVMENVSRPLFVLLNNRFEPQGLGSSLELGQMPEIGVLEHISFSNIQVADTQEMKKVHYRFGKDIMGAPWFKGIRVDAEKDHKIRDLAIRNLRYVSVGGVKRSEIPGEYPQVADQKENRTEKASENYYPDWSRTGFMDIRNVDGFYGEDIVLENLEPDERPPYVIEGCKVWKEQVTVL